MSKTYDEILNEIANENSYNDWCEFVYDSHDHTIIEYTKQAMREAAEQAIDLAAKKIMEKELQEWEDDYREELKNEILEIKSEQK